MRTPRDAGEYVTKLSKADQAKPHWQTAAHELIMAAERGAILMLAEIAMRQVLAHGRPQPVSRKKAARLVGQASVIDGDTLEMHWQSHSPLGHRPAPRLPNSTGTRKAANIAAGLGRVTNSMSSLRGTG